MNRVKSRHFIPVFIDHSSRGGTETSRTLRDQCQESVRLKHISLESEIRALQPPTQETSSHVATQSSPCCCTARWMCGHVTSRRNGPLSHDLHGLSAVVHSDMQDEPCDPSDNN
ncbi:hypothetical protein VZT92_003568 [Zoarces viviparus]|uniref:Uncharacterized protein n=1 Tax=Zoarces viviparus TaxID=48416 RepID=A0AAW1FTY1_ZOAVI